MSNKLLTDRIHGYYERAALKKDFSPTAVGMLRNAVARNPEFVIFAGEFGRYKGLLIPQGDNYDIGIMRVIGYPYKHARSINDAAIGIILSNVQGFATGDFGEDNLSLVTIEDMRAGMQFTPQVVLKNYNTRDFKERLVENYALIAVQANGFRGSLELCVPKDAPACTSRKTVPLFMRRADTYSNNPGFWAMLEDNLGMGLFGR